MNKPLAFALMCVALIGCAPSKARQEQQARFNACSDLKPWVKMADCQNRVAYSDEVGMYDDPGSKEIIAYRDLLIEKVNTKKMTNAQAERAFQQKIAQMNRQIVQENAMRRSLQSINIPQQPLPVNPYYRPLKTDCTRAFGGGISCVTKPTGPDLSVFQRSQ